MGMSFTPFDEPCSRSVRVQFCSEEHLSLDAVKDSAGTLWPFATQTSMTPVTPPSCHATSRRPLGLCPPTPFFPEDSLLLPEITPDESIGCNVGPKGRAWFAEDDLAVIEESSDI